MAAVTARGWQRALWLLALLLLLARLGFLLAQQPLAGFANQFDMLRNSGCLGLQPMVEAAPGAATPQAPIARYATGMPGSSSCLWGTEVAISAIALGLDQVGDALGWGEPGSLPLRLVAVTKALLLLLALAWVDLGLRAHPGVRLVHMWAAALILVDPFNALYLAGFYTEIAALLSAWLALMLPLPWLLSGRAPSTRALLGWGLILAALALSRFQHAVIPLMLTAWLTFLGWRRGWAWPRLAAWPLLILIPALALQLGLQRQYQTIADANRWNSFFGAALPAAGNADEFVANLGLPAQCAELVHTTWYLQRGRDARVECPQAFQLSRLSWAVQLAAEPAALTRMVGRGVALSGQWRPSYLGEVAGAEFQRMPLGPLALGASWADAVSRLPFTVLVCFWLCPLILVWLARRAIWAAPAAEPRSAAGAGEASQAALWLYPMLLLIVLLGWASSLVGDGYSELARHLHLAANAALITLLLGLLALLRTLTVRRTTARRRSLLPDLGLLLCVLFLLWWTGIQSLAFGVLEQPATETATDSLEVSGWAMDPRGIKSVELVYADGTRQALELYARPALAGIFGAGVGRHGLGYRGPLDADLGQRPLAVLVTPVRGAATVIDRRWMK